MRRLVITRGAQGLGKSTLIRGLGLESFTLCPDELRGLWGSPLITSEGRWEVNHQHEAAVWSFLGDRLSERMSRGELVLVDATHTYLPGLLRYLELMQSYGYRGLCVDFSRASLDDALQGNLRRPWRKRVPDQAVRRVWAATQQALPEELAHGFEWLYWDGEGSLEAARAWLQAEERPLSALSPQVLFGDASEEALVTALEREDARPSVWLSPLLSLLAEDERSVNHLQQLRPERLEELERKLKALCKRAPQLTLLRGPLESSSPSWCADLYDDAARWINAGHCLDVHWAPLTLPPPALVCVSGAQLTSTQMSWPQRTQESPTPLHELSPGEWRAEREAALGRDSREVQGAPRWASITRASFPEALPTLSTLRFKL